MIDDKELMDIAYTYGNTVAQNMRLIYERGMADARFNIDSEVIKNSIAHYGDQIQLTTSMEECAELIQALSKYLRFEGSYYNEVVEEVADVYICLELVKTILGIPDRDIEAWIKNKQSRLVNRMYDDMN